jgi:hypothetical protein
MVNLADKTCIYKNCTENAYYNLSDKKEKLYCRNHADLTVMIDITHKDKLCLVREREREKLCVTEENT